MTPHSDSFAFKRMHRTLIAFAFGMTLAVFAYAAIRVLDVVLFPEPNPVVVIWTDRSRFIWRALIASYLGGAGAFGGYRLASRTPERVFVWLERAILLAGGCLVLQTILAP